MAVAGALVFQFAFALFGTLFPGTGGLFGAPLAAGRSSGLGGSLVALGGSTEWWPIPFALDVAVVATALWGAGRIAGIAGLAAAFVGSVVAFLPAPVAFLSWHNISDPWAPPGFPFPVAHEPLGSVDRVALLGDSAIGAALGLGLWMALATRLPRSRLR